MPVRIAPVPFGRLSSRYPCVEGAEKWSFPLDLAGNKRRIPLRQGPMEVEVRYEGSVMVPLEAETLIATRFPVCKIGIADIRP